MSGNGGSIWELIMGPSARPAARAPAAAAAPPVPADQVALTRAQQQQQTYMTYVQREETAAANYRAEARRLAAIDRLKAKQALQSALDADARALDWSKKKRDIDAQVQLLIRAKATATHVAVTAELQRAASGVSAIDADAYAEVRNTLNETHQDLTEIDDLIGEPIGEPVDDLALTQRMRDTRLDSALDDLLGANQERELIDLPLTAELPDLPSIAAPQASVPATQRRVAVASTSSGQMHPIAPASPAASSNDKLRALASKMRANSNKQ